MKNIILLLLFNIPLLSQWKEIESPNGRIPIKNSDYSNSTLSMFTDFDIYYTEDAWSTYNKSSLSKIDSVGIIKKCIKYENTLYVLVLESIYYNGKGGFYKSTDNGKNWSLVDSLLQNHKILDFDVDEKGFHFLTQISYAYINSVYTVVNYGGYINYKNGNIEQHTIKYYNNVLKDSSNITGQNIQRYKNKTFIFDNKLASGSGQSSSKVLISKDNGISFTHKGSEISEDVISAYCFAGDTLVVGKTSIHISTDIGETWKRQQPKTPFYVGLGVLSMVYHKDFLYVSNIDGQIYRSSDLGINWTKIFDNKEYGGVNLISDDNYIYFSCFNGLFSSSDNGDTFGEVAIFDKSLNFQFSQDASDLYLLTYNTSIFKKENINSSWEKLNDSLYNTVFAQSCISVKENSILTAYTSNGELSYSNDKGRTWNSKIVDEISNSFNKVLINKNRFIALSNRFGFTYSDDFGETWNKLNDVPLAQIFNNIEVYNDTLFAGLRSGGILVSENNGDSWNKIESANDSIIKFKQINNIAKNKNVLIASSNGISIFKSEDYGKNWKIVENYQNKGNNRKLINYKENFFAYTNDGFYYSTNNGNDWEKYDIGIEQFNNSKNYIFKDLVVYNSNILLCFYKGIYTLPLSELGIEYTSVEKTEKRNYLYTFPPFPQPTKQEVKISIYWDSALPFTVDDVEIYNLAGVKINTENKLSINKETNYNGHIIWDLSGEQAGIYIVNIKHGTETRTQKVMVEK